MNDTDRTQQEISDALQKGDGPRLAEIIVRHYGGGLLGFLIDRCQSPSDAEEVFELMAERIVKYAHTYSGTGALRAWAYRIAKNAMIDFYNKRARAAETGWTGKVDPRLGDVTKPPWLQTQIKMRARELRSRLSDVDQDILVLRIDREFSWKEVAEYLNDGAFATERELNKAAANARSQFRHASIRLKKLMEEDGLLDSDAND